MRASRFWATIVIGLGWMPAAWMIPADCPAAKPPTPAEQADDPDDGPAEPEATEPAAEPATDDKADAGDRADNEPTGKQSDQTPAKENKEKADGGEQNKDNKKEAEKADPVNPLSIFIKKLLPGVPEEGADENADGGNDGQENPAGNGGKKGADAAGRGKKPPAEPAVERARDQIDSRAPQDVTLAKLYRRAIASIEEQDWRDAQEMLQNLLDPSSRAANGQPASDSLVRLADGRLVSIQSEALRLLGQLPPEELARYRREFGPKADALLKEAGENHDLQGIVSVATRFFHTDAGQNAANLL